MTTDPPTDKPPFSIRTIIVLEIEMTSAEHTYNVIHALSGLHIPGLAPSLLVAVDPAAEHVLDYLSSPERQREIPAGSVYGLDEDDLKDIVKAGPEEV